MSTVDSLLLLVSSSVVKDVYINYIKPDAPESNVKKVSMGVTGVVGVVAFLLAIRPPDLLIFLNLFAFGGLQSAFIWPIVLGLYWSGANKKGAIASMIVGISSYVINDRYNNIYGDFLDVHAVTIPVFLSLIIFVIFSLVFNEKPYEFPKQNINREGRNARFKREKVEGMNMKTYQIAVLPGDGIGPEVTTEAVKVLEALAEQDEHFNFETTEFPWNSDYYVTHGKMMPEDGLEQLKSFDTILFGAIGDARVSDLVTIWELILPIRKNFQQFINFRPIK